MSRSDLEVFDALFRDGARRALRDADLFVEELLGPAPSRLDAANVAEDEPVRTVVVGEPVVIDVAAMFTSMKIEDVEWTIVGHAVGGYEITVARARVLPVDRRAPTLKLHWIAGGRAHVRGKIGMRTIAPPSNRFEISVHYVYDVRAPKLEHLTATTSKPLIHDVVIDPVRKTKKKQLGFGDRIGKKGIQWDVRVTLPVGLSGRFADVQLVRLGRRRELRFPDKIVEEVFRTPAGDRYVLDIDRDESKKPDCSDLTPWYQLSPATAVTSVYARDHAYDVPATDLVGDVVSVEIDERFRYYVLFKPELKDAIWVPVAKAEWFWRAAADRRRVWEMRTTPKPEGGVVGGKGDPTAELPEYDANACLIGWMPA
jgi:hypothetical protein